MSRDPEQIQIDFVQAAQEALDVQSEVSKAHLRLAEQPDEESYEELLEYRDMRNKSIEQLGRLVFEWIFDGGAVRLVDREELDEELEEQEVEELAEEPETEAETTPKIPELQITGTLIDEEPVPLQPPKQELPVDPMDALKILLAVPEWTKDQLHQAVLRCLDNGIRPGDDRLVEILVPYADSLGGQKRFGYIRNKIRKLKRETDEAEPEVLPVEEVDGGSIPEDWPYLPLTRNARAVLVGGDPRLAAATRIRKEFGFSAVQWKKTNHRRTISLAQKIARGGVDYVILLRRYLHTTQISTFESACQYAGIRPVRVDAGYGVNQIRLALERQFGANQGADKAEDE